MQNTTPLPFHSNRYLGNKGQRMVNVFTRKAEAGPQPIEVVAAPGVKAWGTATDDAGCRGRCRQLYKDRIAVVRGFNLYLIDRNGGWSKHGTIPGDGPVSIVSNGAQLMIVAAERGFVFDGALTEVTGADFTGWGSAYVTQIDGRAIHARPDSQLFFQSSINDFTAYDAAEYELKSVYGDNLRAVYAAGNRLFALGETTTEPYYNANLSPFPYARDPNGAIEVGCGAAHSLAKNEGGFYFLGHDNEVYHWPTNAAMPVTVSSDAVTDAIEKMAVTDDATGFIAKFKGHSFYHLVFPTEGQCWMFDERTGLWFERESYELTAWDIAGHIEAWGKNIVFRRSTGEMGLLDMYVEGEWEAYLVSAWTYEEVYAKDRLVAHDELSVAMTTGSNTSYNDEAKLMLEISDDGGNTWRFGPTADAGQRGQYGLRVRHSQLGSSARRVYRHSMANMGSRRVYDAQLRARGAVG